MAFTHTNSVRSSYVAGGQDIIFTVEKTETAGAEMNISQAITTDSITETTDIVLEYFEFQTANKARSIYIRLDGFNGALYAEDSAAAETKMLDLDNGEPYTWSYNAGTSFPAGTSNPMVDDTVKLIIRPDVGAGTETDGTLTLKLLYIPE